MTADRARGALAVLQDADGKFICEVPCGYIVEQTASAHKPRRIQAQRRRRAIKRSDGLWKAEHVAEPTNSVATAWFTSVREPNNAGS